MKRSLFSITSGLDADVERGLRELMQEHARIFALVGKFISLVRSGAEASWLLVLLERIIMLTLIHCQTEENMLHRQGHPCWSRQSEDHHRILEEFDHFHESLLTGRDLTSTEYFHLFDALIIHHLREEPGDEGVGDLTALLAPGSSSPGFHARRRP